MLVKAILKADGLRETNDVTAGSSIPFWTH